MEITAIFLVSIALLITVSHETQTWYVKSTDVNCPANISKAKCNCLVDYVTDTTKYFANNTRFIFLQGTHNLSKLLLINGIHNLSLSSYMDMDEVNIQCVESGGGIIFNNSLDIYISYINLSSCGGRSSQPHPPAALKFDNVAGIYIHKVSITKSTGYGFFANRIRERTIIQHSVFLDNKGGNAQLSLGKCSPNSNNSLLIQHSEFLKSIKQSSQGATGLIVYSHCPHINISLDHVTAANNSGGNIKIKMIDVEDSHWEVKISNCLVEGGHGLIGSGLYFSSRHIYQRYSDCVPNKGNSLEFVNTNFTKNMAEKYAGGMMLKLRDSNCNPVNITLTDCTFDSNGVIDSKGHGAAVIIIKYSIPGFYKRTIPLHDVSIGNTRFRNNAIITGFQASVLELGNIEKATLQDCSFTDNVGTAISMTQSNVIFNGDTLFANNKAYNGGALKFCYLSVIFLNNGTKLTFENNHALQTGGAIFAQDSCLDQPKACFFQPIVSDNTSAERLRGFVELHFANNTAEVAGDAIYGGEIETCFTFTKFMDNSSSGKASYFNSQSVFNAIFSGLPNDNASVSSDPYKVEFCGMSNHTLSVIPGKTFHIGVVAQGQLSGKAPAIITAELYNNSGSFTLIYKSSSTRDCRNLSFILETENIGTSVQLILSVQKKIPQKHILESDGENVTLTVEQCPWGFALQTGKCDCIACIKDQGYNCDLDSLQVNITNQFRHISWVGCEKPLNGGNCTNQDLLSARSCGLQDYCNHDVNLIEANSVDRLCSEGRTGILCGSCVKGLSVVLGTGKCKPCSNVYLSLVVVYLGAGILLIIILSKFRLTVNHGSMNGLIFYANTIHWNRKVFFPIYSNADILRLIIAWLNLDLGIEVCLFNGMTVVHLLWLEIAYIVYIVFLQFAIVFLCRKYVIFTRLLGRNVTKVMSTLIILLYSKTLRTLVNIFTFTTVMNTSNNNKTKVLSVDGNIEFGSLQHIPLLVVGSLLALLLLLFTFSLLFIQILSRISSWRFFKWVSRLQPFFETITGPCNSNYAFWPGYLLFVRILFSFTLPLVVENFRISYFVSGFAILTIIFSFLNPQGVYKQWSLNILEFVLLFNLAVTSLVLLGSNLDKDFFSAITYCSVVLAFSSFLVYHAHSYSLFKRLKRVSVTSIAFCMKCLSDQKGSSQVTQSVVTHTEVTVSSCTTEERSPLMTAQVMPPVLHNYGKLRESLIESD